MPGQATTVGSKISPGANQSVEPNMSSIGGKGGGVETPVGYKIGGKGGGSNKGGGRAIGSGATGGTLVQTDSGVVEIKGTYKPGRTFTISEVGILAERQQLGNKLREQKLQTEIQKVKTGEIKAYQQGNIKYTSDNQGGVQVADTKKGINYGTVDLSPQVKTSAESIGQSPNITQQQSVQYNNVPINPKTNRPYLVATLPAQPTNRLDKSQSYINYNIGVLETKYIRGEKLTAREEGILFAGNVGKSLIGNVKGVIALPSLIYNLAKSPIKTSKTIFANVGEAGASFGERLKYGSPTGILGTLTGETIATIGITKGTTVISRGTKYLDVVNPYAIKSDSAFFIEKNRGLVSGQITDIPNLGELRLKYTPSQFVKPSEQIRLLSGKEKVLATVSANKPPFKFSPFTGKSTYEVAEVLGASGMRLKAGGVERGQFFAPAEKSTNIAQAYSYYSGLNPTTPIDYLSSKLSFGKSKPSITLAKDIISKVPNWAKQGALSLERGTLTAAEKQAFYLRLATDLNVPDRFVAGVAAIAARRGEYEVVATLGTRFERIPTTLRGKLGAITNRNLGDYFVRLPSGEKFEIYFSKRIPQASTVPAKGISNSIGLIDKELFVGKSSSSQIEATTDISPLVKNSILSLSDSSPSKIIDKNNILSSPASQTSDFSSSATPSDIFVSPRTLPSGGSSNSQISKVSSTPSITILSPTSTPNVNPSKSKSITSIPKSVASISTSKSISSIKPKISQVPRKNILSKSKLPVSISLRNAFDVFIRKRGKEVRIATGLPKGKATQLGVKRNLRDLSASFRLKARGTTAQEDINFEAPSNLFRPSKRNAGTLVQRRGARLGARTEVTEIISAKRNKNRRFKLW